MTHGNKSHYPFGPDDICPPGLLLPLIDERLFSIWLRATAYFLWLLYFFIGTALITQIFMASIDRITSHTKKVYLANYKTKKNESSDSIETVLREDEPDVIEVRVWNDTVANLILMAFGTAAPEILLSIVETVAHNFESGKLGPGTIVGSAAFNLFIITSVCMLALPLNETKRIHRLRVFIVTAFFSFFSYIWLLLILRYFSPDVVELWEASITFVLFPILIIFAYLTDRNYFGFVKKNDMKRQLELNNFDSNDKNTKRNFIGANNEIDKENLINFIRETKKFPKLTDEDIAILAATKIIDSSTRSANWHRINSVKPLVGSSRIRPKLNSKLKEVYEIIKQNPDGVKLEDIPKDPDLEKNAVIEFQCPTIAVKENVGQFYVSVCRFGNLQPEVKVRVDSIDGTAKQNSDYFPVKEILTFLPYESEKKIAVKIIDDKIWEPDEEFFLKLTIIGRRNELVKLGQYPIMEITIIDDDEPGIIMFEKRGLVVKESAGVISIPIVRFRGTDGKVSVKWKTMDKSAINGRDYIGGEGEIVFNHNEATQKLNLTIIDDLNPEKDEYFEVVLFEPTGGAKLGNINRILITISNDDDFNSITHRLMLLTGANLDAIKVHTETWTEQFKQAMNVNGGDVENATFLDYIMHFISFFWKVLFAFVPPVCIFNGWLCFFISLCVIGIITTIIADMATIFGCLIGLDDTLTAITIVALGTTLPDILGAQMVTRAEKHADGALVHISGSIAVNVLIGVGVPWFVAAIYHYRMNSVFRVHSKGLEFNVLSFSVAAIIAISLLFIRRNFKIFGKAELGGPTSTRYVTVAILVALWIIYLLLNFLEIANIINY